MARVTSKGQITIPVKIRRALEIDAGDDVLFDLTPEGARVRVRKRARLTDLYRSLPVSRPYPGKVQVRAEAGRALGKTRHERSPTA
jgi:AbrB family looped-hinge helix DNA binding protein